MPTAVANQRRKCIQCGQSKSLTDFPPSGRTITTKAEMTRVDQWKCSICRRENRTRHPRTTGRLRRDILAFSGGRCSYCDRPFAQDEHWHADHVMPRAHGGDHALSNLVAACARCNAGILATFVNLFWLLDSSGARRRSESPFDRVYPALLRSGLSSALTFWDRRRLVRAILEFTTYFQRTNDVPEDSSDIDLRVEHLSVAARGVRPVNCAP